MKLILVYIIASFMLFSAMFLPTTICFTIYGIATKYANR